ncbi:MAG: hypothetical protein AB7D96_02230 [Arcobacteraceae bacterium]
MKRKLTKEQIKEKQNALLEQFKKSTERYKNGRSSPTQEFLTEIDEQIREAIEGGLSATQISRDIKTVFGIAISATTVRGYVKNKLGIKNQNNVSPRAKSIENSSAQVNRDESISGDNERIKTKVNDI